MSKKPEGSTAKRFTLKKTEAMVINQIQASANNDKSMFLVHLATDRWAYPVTQNTQFKFLDNNEVEVSELEPEPKQKVADAVEPVVRKAK